jgi:hypothetical protein
MVEYDSVGLDTVYKQSYTILSNYIPDIAWTQCLIYICKINRAFHCQHRGSRTFPVESREHDSGRTLVRAEYGYPKGSPNTNS